MLPLHGKRHVELLEDLLLIRTLRPWLKCQQTTRQSAEGLYPDSGLTHACSI